MSGWNKVTLVMLVISGFLLSTVAWSEDRMSGSVLLQNKQTIKNTKGQVEATPMPLPEPEKAMENQSSEATLKDKQGQVEATPMPLPGPEKRR